MSNYQVKMATNKPESGSPQLKKLLLINPNSSKSMTEGIENLIKDLGQSTTFNIITYTAPSGPPSINNEDDALESAEHVLADLEKKFGDYDAFLVACYSVHPLVSQIKERVRPSVLVTGIFEASIVTALALLPQRGWASPREHEKFGIVTTGSYWEKALSKGVAEIMGLPDSTRFKSVQSTGLNAGELHTASPEDVRTKMKDATKRLLRDKNCSVICLGCAGMAGMDHIVREAIVEELGEELAGHVKIVDGIKVGIGLLEGLSRALPT